MSTSGRTTQRSGKNTKVDTVGVKGQKQEIKSDATKTWPTAEQIRIAQIINSKTEDATLRNKIKQVMDATKKSEDEVCTALHDCDNDANTAVNYLLEGASKQNEWFTSGKKKKNRTASASKTDAQVNNHIANGAEGEEWEGPHGAEASGRGGQGRSGRSNGGHDREQRPRTRGNGPPRMRGRGSLENRGWRARENKENERNLEDGGGGGYNGEGRRGRGGRMSNGPMRGRGGRGRGVRTFQNKDKISNQKFSPTIDTWNNPTTETTVDKEAGGDFPSPEDWDNEEYTGSLADSKVFTPSAGPEPPSTIEDPNISVSGHISSETQDNILSQPQMTSSPVGVNTLNAAQSQYLSQFTQSSENFSTETKSVGPNSLTAAQTQYLSQFTQSSSDYKSTLNNVNNAQQAASTSQVFPQVFTPSSATCTSSYGASVNIYTSNQQELNSAQSQNNSTRSKTQKPRLPPPSKIPSTAVEMPPGDAVSSSIGFLDVQFGGLEFGSNDPPLDNASENSPSVPSAPVTVSAPTQTPSVPPTTVSPLDVYNSSSTQQQTSAMTPSLNQTQKLNSGDSLISSEPPVVSNSYSASTVRTGAVVSNSAPTSLSELTSVTKSTADVSSLSYGSASEPTSIYQTTSTYQKTTTPAYQTPVSTYNTASYSSTQVTTSTSVYSNNTSQVGNYSSVGGTGGGYTTSVNSASTTPAVNAYPNTNSYGAQQANNSSYAYASYPTAGSANAGYQSTGQAYPPQSAVSAAVYGAYPYNNMSYNSTNPPVASTQQNHKISATVPLSSSNTKDSQYDVVQPVVANSMATTVSSMTSVTTASTTSSLGLSSSNQSAAASSSTKVTSIPAAGKSGSVVPNIPPGVPPILSTTQYIMGQSGLQYYQQPVFGYDDATAAIQVIPQRLPPHVVNPGYFDLGFQPPTSLAAGRDGLASVAYSMPDVRFTRADNNTSPIPSTLSQQSATQAAHQQPMINPGIPPAYAYIYGGSMFPAGNFQYGPPMYTPVAPSATASGHGNSTSTQYTKGPGGYGSASYGSGYETGTNADYSGVKVGAGSTGYTAAPAQNKSATGVGAPSGTNQSSTNELMYNKSHASLGKVNSYEKQGFHSGTPPPFNMTGNQTTGIPQTVNTYAPHVIFSGLPHQQHHSTTIMHQQPMHQMEIRNQGRRTDGGTGTSARSQSSSQQNKTGTKQNYSPSYWNPN